jgi:hypothetical protein
MLLTRLINFILSQIFRNIQSIGHQPVSVESETISQTPDATENGTDYGNSTMSFSLMTAISCRNSGQGTISHLTRSEIVEPRHNFVHRYFHVIVDEPVALNTQKDVLLPQENYYSHQLEW